MLPLKTPSDVDLAAMSSDALISLGDARLRRRDLRFEVSPTVLDDGVVAALNFVDWTFKPRAKRP